MFTVFCPDKKQVYELLNKISQINIKRILLISPSRNHTGDHPDCRFIINVYCEIQVNVEYMTNALKKLLNNRNYLQFYECEYYTPPNDEVYNFVE